MNAVNDFIAYSIKREKKILVFYLNESGQAVRENIRVISEEQGQITYLYRKKQKSMPVDRILSAGYARGDAGDIEG